MQVNSRNTKAEILAAYQQLYQESQRGATWQQVAIRLHTTWLAVKREVPLLVRDFYNAGVITRRWTSEVIDALSLPVVR